MDKVAVKLQLRPCPFGTSFCGFVEFNTFGYGSHDRNYVFCDCGATGAGGDTEEDAIVQWNHRVPNPYSLEKDLRLCLRRIARLRTAIDNARVSLAVEKVEGYGFSDE